MHYRCCVFLSLFGKITGSKLSDFEWGSDFKSSLYFQFSDSKTPIVIWHGLGQSCCDPNAIGRVKKLIEETTKGQIINDVTLI